MAIIGSIDYVDRFVLKGWAANDGQVQPISLYIDDELKFTIESFEERPDVFDAGFTDQNCGFNVDISEYIPTDVSQFNVKLRFGENLIEEQTTKIGNITNHVINPYFSIDNNKEIKDWRLVGNHRIGVTFDRFLSPNKLSHISKYYTRMSFGDTNSSMQDVNLIPQVTDIQSSYEKLDAYIIAKASHVTSLTLCVNSNDEENIIWSEPISIYKNWDAYKIELPAEIVNILANGAGFFSLKTTHSGRRFIDVQYFSLAEDALNLFELDINLAQSGQLESAMEQQTSKNLIKNGHFDNWSFGTSFLSPSRGQELADNWFVEYKKTNSRAIDCIAQLDNYRRDSLASSLEPNYGLRIRTKELSGYARLVNSIHVNQLDFSDYELSIEIENVGISKMSCLPRIFWLARDTNSDVIVADVVRKVTVRGRDRLSYIIKSNKIEKIIADMKNLPVLMLVIDLPSNSDICIYKCTLSKVTASDSVNIEHEEQQTDTMIFEDDCITQQLSILKGLDDWNKQPKVKEISPSSFTSENRDKLIESLRSVEDFEAEIVKLKPQKFTRQSRHAVHVDVIIPVYNACNDVFKCLSSLVENTDVIHRVVVINDGNDERTRNMLSAFDNSFNHIVVETNKENLGYTKSVNVGIEESNADWVVILNSDTIVTMSWLKNMLNCALHDENAGMIGPLSNAASWQSVPEVFDKSGDWSLNSFPAGLNENDLASIVSSSSIRAYPSVKVINGFCQLVSMSMLDEIGLLDEEAFPRGYGEENDMCARAVKAGYKLFICDDVYVYHAKSKSFGHSLRKQLAKIGSESLKQKHPDVSWSDVTKSIYNNRSLIQLRDDISRKLKDKIGE